MTDYAAVQELQHLLQRPGWQHLLGLMATALNSAFIQNNSSFYSPQAGTERHAGTPSTSQRLFETFQMISSSGMRHAVTREPDKGFCEELRQIIMLMESMRQQANTTVSQYRSRDSGTFIPNMEDNTQPNISTNAGSQNNSPRHVQIRAPNLQNNMLAGRPRESYTAPNDLQSGWMSSRTAAAFPQSGYIQTQFDLSNTTNVRIYEQQQQQQQQRQQQQQKQYQQQQQPSHARIGANSSWEAAPQASSVERYQPPPVSYAESPPRDNSGPTRQLVANPNPTLLTPDINPQLLNSHFKWRPQKFFRVGRVLSVLWTETEGSTADAASVCSFPVAYGERAQAKIRRFIIFAQKQQHSLAIPITSHQGYGVANRSDRVDHGIVYMGTAVPQPLQGERGMLPTAIRITPDDPTERLKPTSRINYGKIYTIEHNMKANAVGMVHEDSIRALVDQQNEVQRRAPIPILRGM
ncbi:hypothetical protein CB0940_08198 [Cercospora beticola]|uniref:DUF6590 domain-containing protein n=1 Tax=Cercospora beticola TaxID=122368 RepID=A0A2G5HRD6_CERBT|nr:hypothetical protein CB0940_08198 [Cercospora beticola]PIA94792.1 hypothetical protein CB0940_08198 [Cercospora beticola]WPB04765.1 hypothetical protein RHO25_009412 [Cercospora beticola]